MPVPVDRTGVRSFIGLASYYRRFIQSFAAHALPLTKLTKLDVPWEWGQEQQDAFEFFKHALTNAPILVRPDFSIPFTLATDWQPGAVGAVLSQHTGDEEHVVAYASQTLTKSQLNWGATDGECYAAIWAVKHFRPYLYGVQFTLLTDHAALQYLMTSPNLSGRLLRWSVALQEFHFTVKYRPGRLHANADALSRLPLPPTSNLAALPMVMMTTAGTAAGPSSVGEGDMAPEQNASQDTEPRATPPIETQIQGSPTAKDKSSSPDQYADTSCCICEEGEEEDGADMILCDGCERGYHLDCLKPPLKEVPKGEWLCPACNEICMRQAEHEEDVFAFPDTQCAVPRKEITVSRFGLDALTEKPAPELYHDIYNDSTALVVLQHGRMPENTPAREKYRVKQRLRGYRTQENVIYKLAANGQERIVPAPSERQGLIAHYHNDFGHFHARRVYDSLRTKYYWSNMDAEVKAFIADCEPCKKRDIKFDYQPAELHPIPVLGIINRLHIDLKGPLPETASGNK